MKVRTVSLHTLHHGTVMLPVSDFVCHECKTIVPYDGLSDGTFYLNKKQAFTREILDIWLWDLCGAGGTFRDIFYSWEAKKSAISALFHQISPEDNLNRQTCNEAFTSFLKLLKFSRNEHLNSFFLVQLAKK